MLSDEQPQRIKLKIRQVNQRQFEVLATTDMTITDLKTILSIQTDIPVASQRLICQGKLLQDDKLISFYKLSEGSVIQLTSKPEVQEPEVQEAPNRRLRVLSQNERFETLRQNIQTTNLMFDILNQRTEEEVVGFDNSKRKFFPGQWVDVLDTVEQWLEAQILEIANTSTGSMVFVHYNGWPSQWDEWIDSGSARIQPFHSYTNQSISAPTHSPHPTVGVDEGQIRIQGPNDATELLKSGAWILERMKGLLERYQKTNTLYKFEKANEKVQEKRARSGLDNCEEVKDWEKSEDSDQDAISVDLDQDSVEDVEIKDTEMTTETELGLLTVQTAPLLDRTGRLISDLAALVPVSNVPVMPTPAELSQINANGRNDMGIHIYAFVTPRRNN